MVIAALKGDVPHFIALHPVEQQGCRLEARHLLLQALIVVGVAFSLLYAGVLRDTPADAESPLLQGVPDEVLAAYRDKPTPAPEAASQTSGAERLIEALLAPVEAAEAATETRAADTEPQAGEDGLLVAAEPACRTDEQGTYCLHTVAAGEALSTIAAAYGLSGNDSFSAAELLAMSNGISAEDPIQPGQELRVPLASGVLHAVKHSEALSVLAAYYGVSTADIISVAANRISDPNQVVEGKVLLIPAPTTSPALTAEAETSEDETSSESDASEPREHADELTALSEEPPEQAAGDVEPAAEAEAIEEAATGEPGEADGDGAEAETDTSDEEPSEAEPATTESEGETKPIEAASAGGEVLDQRRDTLQNRVTRQLSPPGPIDVEAVKREFRKGYQAANGPEDVLEHILNKVIACESSYNVRAYNPAGPFYGLLQFLPDTWQRLGGGDWFDAEQQGINAARLLRQVSNPRSQWPACW